MNSEEIREINKVGQTQAMDTKSVSSHEAALDSLKISMLAEIAAQLAELNEQFLRYRQGLARANGWSEEISK